MRNREGNGFEGAPTVEAREKEHSPLERLRMKATGAVLQWMEVATRKLGERKDMKALSLSRSNELGAAFLASTFMTLMAGCSFHLKEIECSPEDEEFISAGLEWVAEHPEEIQKQMDLLWPDSSIDANQLIDSLMEAKISCGEPIQSDETAQASARIYENAILVNVKSDKYNWALEAYQENKWIEDYSDAQLLEIYHKDDAVDVYVSDYYYYLNHITQALAHEAGHLATGKTHTGEVDARIEEIIEEEGALPSDFAPDEIYAWTNASDLAMQEQRRDYMDLFDKESKRIHDAMD